ncbi:hypothetical protein [Streptomyces sp. NPDC055287]
MTTTPRQRFSVRAGLAEAVDDDAPYDGLPAHLRQPLRSWFEAQLGASEYRGADEGTALSLCLQMRMEITGNQTASDRVRYCHDDELLDLVDHLLELRARSVGSTNRDSALVLNWMLSEGGSAYRVNDDRDGLEVRVPAAVRDAVKETVTTAASLPAAGSAADHLATAWKASYGRQPDPVRAYSEAIKAVECAAHAVIQPNHARATLGTMLGEISGSARPKFTTALSTPVTKDPIAPVESMMRALWDGQTSRHGKQTPTQPETLEAARAGVHIAATLVQWFTSGTVTRAS